MTASRLVIAFLLFLIKLFGFQLTWEVVDFTYKVYCIFAYIDMVGVVLDAYILRNLQI